MANIPEGYELIVGRTRENAIAALASAEEKGFPAESVLTISDGFLVPLTDDERENGVEVEGESLESLKVDELKALAAQHEIDLGDATKKADIIAAIEASDKIPVLSGAADNGEN